jgi:hypothetical protein
MSALSDTLLTTGGSAIVGQREDLANTISRIDPGETPVWNWCGSGTATNKSAHDWLTVDLAGPTRTPRAEGDEFTNSTPKLTTRLINACEIHSTTYGVSRTSQAVTVAGDAGSMNFQRLHKGMELRKGLELMLIGPQDKVATDPRECAGLQAFAGRSSVGVGGTGSDGVGDTDVVFGTERALTVDLMNNELRASWQEGAQIGLFFMSGAQKLAFDAVVPLDGIGDNNVALKNEGATITTTVAVWKSTFGDVKVVLDRIMDEQGGWGQQMILGFDERSQYRPKICPLPGQSFVTTPLAKTTDSTREAMLWEGTVEVPNPKAVLLIGALSDAYAS